MCVCVCVFFCVYACVCMRVCVCVCVYACVHRCFIIPLSLKFEFLLSYSLSFASVGCLTRTSNFWMKRQVLNYCATTAGNWYMLNIYVHITRKAATYQKRFLKLFR